MQQDKDEKVKPSDVQSNIELPSTNDVDQTLQANSKDITTGSIEHSNQQQID